MKQSDNKSLYIYTPSEGADLGGGCWWCSPSSTPWEDIKTITAGTKSENAFINLCVKNKCVILKDIEKWHALGPLSCMRQKFKTWICELLRISCSEKKKQLSQAIMLVNIRVTTFWERAVMSGQDDRMSQIRYTLADLGVSRNLFGLLSLVN